MSKKPKSEENSQEENSYEEEDDDEGFDRVMFIFTFRRIFVWFCSGCFSLNQRNLK